MSKISLQRGDIIPVDVGPVVCSTAMPCDKRECLQSLASAISLTKRFGRRNYYIKSTAAGIQFTLDGYRYSGAFDSRGVKNLVKLDRTYRLAKKAKKTDEEAIEAARAVIKPYKSSFIVMAKKKIAPKATRDRKDQINELRNAKRAEIIAAGGKPKKYGPYKHGTARELSL